MSLTAVTAVALLVAVLPTSGAVRPANFDCTRTQTFSGCDGHGEIVVSGSANTSTHKPGGDASSPEVVRYFACSSGVPRQLSVADAPFADADCRIAGPTCAKAAAADGRPREAVLTLRRRPDGSWQYEGWNCLTNGRPQVTAAMVRAQATRLIPSAAIGLAPEQATLVNIQTVMWVDAPSQRVLPNVTILGQSVQITIRLEHVSWDFGDGDARSTTSAGKPYDARSTPCDTKMCPGYFGHVYRRTGIRTISATATWSATFTVGAGQPETIPGTVTGPTATAAIHVKEARGVLVPNPGEH